MERRLAITYIVSATATFGIGCFAIAAASGGLFASAAPKPVGGKQIEVIDDYIVIHSSTTVAATDAASTSVEPVLASTDSLRAAIARPSATATPDAGAAASPDVAPTPAPSPTAAPRSAAPVAAPAPAPAAPVATQPEPTDPPEAPAPEPTAAKPPAPAPATTTPAARPPIPDGCENPQFRNGQWQCDDD